MKSIKDIFYIGHGPSSSHTIGPYNATQYVLNKYKTAKQIDVTLYGSLASTGKGHLTDYIIDMQLKDVIHHIFFNNKKKMKHPNTMIFEITLLNDKKVKEVIESIGGGAIKTSEKKKTAQIDVYPHESLREILQFCNKKGYKLEDYILRHEGQIILDYIDKLIKTIEEAIERGIRAEGDLPGNLHVKRKARLMYQNMVKENKTKDIETNVVIASFAVAEENASGGLIVVAPTCGSAGVIPGVYRYLKLKKVPLDRIKRGFLVSGLIGLLAKTNASISGAEAGCQAEIGVACAMGAALITTALGYDNYTIAQSAEIALEHSLGLTCDPVQGYVQIPCIERCAMFALKAIDAASIAAILPIEANKITFDESLLTMYLTGKDLKAGYRETAKKGLAKVMGKK